MTKSAIFSLLPVRATSTVASVRIAKWLSNTLNIPLYDDAKILQEDQLDNLFIVNGSTAFCKHLAELSLYIPTTRNVIWVQNDYTLPPPKAESMALSPFRRAFADRHLVPHYWTTCRENSTLTDHSAWVNWNVLGYDTSTPQSKAHQGTDYFYYGAYRVRREKEFAYIADAAGSVTVSSTSKNFDNFFGFNRIDPIRALLHRELASHGLGIYCQDDRSASADHCPATRFYEMLSAGLPMVFTPGCVETLGRYGYDVSPYVLTRERRLPLLAAREEIAADQMIEWSGPYVDTLTQQVKALYDALD